MNRADLLKGFEYLRTLNVRRCTREFEHPLESWSSLEWAGAMCGEAGEAANVSKKIKRLDMNLFKFKDNMAMNRESLKFALSEELADTVLYADLCAAAADIDLCRAIIDKFNKNSVEYGAGTLL